jgi:nucleoside-diphosphate-sugar epimerase
MGGDTRRALVTGANGFIGQQVMAALQQQMPAVQPFVSDVREMAAYDEPVDVVIHLAAIVRHDQFTAAPQHGYDVNVIGTQSVLAYCRRVGARCVLASTSAVYRAATTPLEESAALAPQSPYAMSKWLAERLCGLAAQRAGVPAIVLRVFNVYGPGQHPEFLIPHVTSSLVEGRPIMLRMPHALRDFVYLDDVADAFCRAACLVHHGFRVFNVGSGVGTSVADMVRTAEKVFGARGSIDTSPQHADELAAAVADTTRARRELGWAARHDLVAGLQAMKAAMAR